jgi:1,4-dihydroxy-2-naphthoyl-CoA hydrolase
MPTGARVGARRGLLAGRLGRVTDAQAPQDPTDLDITGEFVAWLGLELTETTGDRVTATWEAQPKLHQPYGIVHGGVHCSVVETLASIGGALWLGRRARSSG